MFEWLVSRASERKELELGEAPEGLLNAAELEVLGRLRFPARRRKWLLGRWAVKRLLGEALKRAGTPVVSEELTIANEGSGLPYALVGAQRLEWSISISHREGLAIAGVCTRPNVTLGVDVELVQPRDEVLVRDFFAEVETQALSATTGRQRDLRIARGWSVKESVLKALGVGLRVDTRQVVVGRDEVLKPWPQGWTGVYTAVSPWPPEVPRRALTACWRDEGAYVLSAALAS